MHPSNRIIILMVMPLLVVTGVAAQTPNSRTRLRDSLMAENIRMNKMVDSLRKDADHLDTLRQTSIQKVAALKTSRDTALLSRWKRIQEHLTQKFDLTLFRLDRSLGLLNTLSKRLDSLSVKPTSSPQKKN